MLEDCDHRRARGGWLEDAVLNRCSFPIGPRNTWSNVAYPLVGLGIVLLHPSSAAWAMLFALTLLGIGSGAYHGWKTRLTNRMDWAGMYAVFAGLIVHGIAPAHLATPWIMVVAGAIIAWLFAFQLSKVDLNTQIGFMLAVASIPAFLLGAWELALVSIWIFGFGFLAWRDDKMLGGKSLGLWGHAIWHVLTAIAIGFMFIAQER